MPVRSNEHNRFFDRAFSWVAEHVFGYHDYILSTKVQASTGVVRPNKPVKSYGSSSYRFYRVRPNEIGFTGSKEMYKTVKEAIERTGLRYRLRYFGTRISPR